MKIKLSKDMRFEPSKRMTKSYIFGLLIIVLTGLLPSANIYLTIGSLILLTIIFIWLETTYYPYGISENE